MARFEFKKFTIFGGSGLLDCLLSDLLLDTDCLLSGDLLRAASFSIASDTSNLSEVK